MEGELRETFLNDIMMIVLKFIAVTITSQSSEAPQMKVKRKKL
jgi:hypothetical protein